MPFAKAEWEFVLDQLPRTQENVPFFDFQRTGGGAKA
jgi:hypothetical protein